MRKSENISLISENDYHNIEETINRTEIGRRFLAEYTQRNRAHDTLSLLEIIKRFENAVIKYGNGGVDKIKKQNQINQKDEKTQTIIFVNGEKPEDEEKNKNQLKQKIKEPETQI